jgi:ABC-type Zn uptake system ZnuABC Zn-binding protein ZnuA
MFLKPALPRWGIALLILLCAACTPAQSQTPAAGGKLRVTATTTIVGDVVRHIGGEAIELAVLLPAGADPHNFEPAPRDIAAVSEAQVIFTNGAGLEEFMQRLIENAGGEAQVVPLSDTLDLITASPEEDEHGRFDPHVWLDPNNVARWAPLIAASLSELDPANTASYQENASRYLEDLQALDSWIQEQVSQIPKAERNILSDHLVFAYFARRYDFEQVGAAVPAFSTLAEPSAQELAALEDQIRQGGVKAILVGTTVNPALSERIARDTGIQVVPIYSGSLSPPDGPAPTYLDYMRYNVSAIVQALR